MKPSIGRIVHYKLSAYDAEAINRRRSESQAHVGNRAEAGQIYPATIVRIFDPEGDTGTSNLQVTLDGNDTHWATSRKTGDEEGAWSWPPRV